MASARRASALSLLMAVGGTTQIALSGAEKWTGALPPLGALFVFVLAAVLVRRDLRHCRASSTASPER